MVAPLFAGNLQHPSSKFASRYDHLKTILERCKNHTLTSSMCNHRHAPAHTKLHYSRVWLRPLVVAARLGSPGGILEDGVVMFADRVPGRLGTKPPPSYSRHKAPNQQSQRRFRHSVLHQ